MRIAANKAADLQALSYHYDRLALRVWEEILASTTQVKLKRYCYALRSALALAWIGSNQTALIEVCIGANRAESLRLVNGWIILDRQLGSFAK